MSRPALAVWHQREAPGARRQRSPLSAHPADPAPCPAAAVQTMQLQKALDADLRLAAVEGSTHYGRQGHALAPSLARVLPWLRIIVSLREPIRWGSGWVIVWVDVWVGRRRAGHATSSAAHVRMLCSSSSATQRQRARLMCRRPCPSAPACPPACLALPSPQPRAVDAGARPGHPRPGLPHRVSPPKGFVCARPAGPEQQQHRAAAARQQRAWSSPPLNDMRAVGVSQPCRKDVHKCLKDSLKKGDYFTPFQVRRCSIASPSPCHALLPPSRRARMGGAVICRSHQHSAHAWLPGCMLTCRPAHVHCSPAPSRSLNSGLDGGLPPGAGLPDPGGASCTLHSGKTEGGPGPALRMALHATRLGPHGGALPDLHARSCLLPPMPCSMLSSACLPACLPLSLSPQYENMTAKGVMEDVVADVKE